MRACATVLPMTSHQMYVHILRCDSILCINWNMHLYKLPKIVIFSPKCVVCSYFTWIMVLRNHAMARLSPTHKMCTCSYICEYCSYYFSVGSGPLDKVFLPATWWAVHCGLGLCSYLHHVRCSLVHSHQSHPRILHTVCTNPSSILRKYFYTRV